MAIEESRAEAIFFAALEKQALEDRIAYLDDACANDASLRQRVEARRHIRQPRQHRRKTTAIIAREC